MQCQQTEPRLQELLDSRCEIDSDPALVAHCEVCPQCAELATAYDAMAAGRLVSLPPLVGLADRVVDEVLVERAKPQAAARPAWGALVVAASLLIAVGLAIRNVGTPNSDSPATTVAVEELVPAPNGPAIVNVPGQEMWYRTGQGLASISLTSLRTRDTSAMEVDSTSDPQLFQRAYDAVRQMWPTPGESQTPNGETGWLYAVSPLMVV